ncbi:urea ABC transporter permease subunit UrtB [Cytophaga hutchinsonii]|jgi:urea transport system permease protein|uniref:Amino acid/amide ABC transporter membrane protein 1, HAAT family n=1 Tax=Cytophaga hutchinsonii (strain ATCC 33406 / DSM 1761 / CIP 103989 / NBRC 15051 / NCIMB 9469 / D465) TaxID=269798 RepID=A0A6N4SQH1_CYTH3|nr:urea ABC transporter permease subunit UrtB [Cytophaga hutchinsonii]ABG58528.1 amino acid/amide ABC transporter membrane protein 1, HAAT family [Cytophaga hutchinsonii ATCC 33406]SFX76299.1 amino acid/amide ABC transporter membrane protein 1, HAAT family [Cytophaga hutchinsonii ATCC 33406]
MKHLLYITLLFWGSLVSGSSLQKDSLSYFVHASISGNDSIKQLSVKRLVESGNTDVYPFLAAVYDKKIYLFKDQPVTTGVRTTGEDGTDFYEVYTLYPVNAPVKDGAGVIILQPISKLKEVTFGRSERLLIGQLGPYLNLSSADAEKRKAAYGQFQALKDKEALPALYAARAKETSSDVKSIAQETIFSIELNASADDNRKKILIDSLVINWGSNTESILEAYEASEKNPELKAYAKAAIADLNGKHERLSVVQNLFSGLSLGSILIMVALGLSIIYGLAGIINMAHGEFLMIGAYTTFIIQSLLPKGDLFFWISLPVSFLVAGAFGFIIERLIIRYLYSRPLESLLATWGVSLVLIQFARTLFGDLTAVRTPAVLSGGWEITSHLVLPYNRLFIIGLCIFMIAITYYTLYKTRLGLRVRAVTQNRNMSSCLGIETGKVDAITFFLGSGLAGTAGCAMTLIGNVVPDMGQTYIVDSFLVVVTGGVGNIAGTIVSGFGIGFIFKILESFFEAVYGKVLILAIIILFLQFKPKGLFPDKGRIAED